MKLLFNLPDDTQKFRAAITGHKFKAIANKLNKQLLCPAYTGQSFDTHQTKLYNQIRKEFCLILNNIIHG